MKLDKAIEINGQLEHHSSLDFSPAELHAIKLGIEALERVANARQQYSGWSGRPLPGETEE